MRIFKKFQNVFKKKIQLTGRIIDMNEHSYWGDSIYFSNLEARRITGHMPNRPVVGDVLVVIEDGKRRAGYIVVKMEYMSDPPDMFFGNVSFIGYEERKVDER